MANGHVPGRVNPFAQIGQTLAERQQQGFQAIQSLLQGQTPQLPGLPAGGFTPDFRSLNQFKDAALAALRDNPMLDLSSFEQAFIQPLMSSSVPGQLLALDYYTQKADITQNLGAFPQQFATIPGGGSIDAIIAQSRALSTLGQQFAHDPRFQQMLSGFVSALAPTGQAATLSTPALAALANPFLQQLAQFGGNLQAAGLPAIQFPTELRNIPQQRRNVIEAIAEAALSTQGQQVTPFGLLEQTPTSFLDQLLDLGRQALNVLPGINFGQPTTQTGTGAPGMATGPAPTAPPNAPTASETSQTESTPSPQSALQAIQNTLQQMGASAQWTLASLLQNRQRLTQLLGPEGYNSLFFWAQLNLPNQPTWTPPMGVDPIQAALNVLSRR